MKLKFWSEAFAQPSSDLRHVAACSRHQMPRSPRFEVFEVRRLRVNQEAGRNREGWALRRIRQTREAERTADANRASENPRCQFRQPDKLRGAAG
jgi:hypothetical protein